ncbi:helix-turn-helix domain-containing protein [Oribacterium sp. WCC10]|uniref:helix-turn-helix domain-containing protein n=1 Tax=Oribacterium sp. WCC10 TaxID=1855343 RepID=UPI0008E2D31F|nr:AraC family transcriptional regulator [Oribacterium sp. WCC10]SFG58737.1 Helix-turn-helix domain-containing protein [Oribacterium sp. WCC10]
MRKLLADGENRLRKVDTDWVKNNMLFNYILYDDNSLLTKSFVDNNSIEINFDPSNYYLCISGANKKYNLIYDKTNFSIQLHAYHEVENHIYDLMDKTHYKGNQCLLKIDNSKQSAIIFTPEKSTTCTPEKLAGLMSKTYIEGIPHLSKYSVTSLVGPFHSFEMLNIAYQEARRLNDLYFFNLSGAVITQDLIDRISTNNSVGQLFVNLRSLRNSMCTGSSDEALKLCDYIFDSLLAPSFSMVHVNYAYVFFEDLFNTFELVYQEIQPLQFNDINDFYQLKDFQAYVKANIKQVMTDLKKTKRFSAYIMLTIGFIRGNINQDLSLSRLAGYVSITPASLSNQFHAETGVALTEFISNERIEFAKKLLRSTSDTTEVISQKSGFASVQYFRKVFKRITGSTPGEYRKGLSN